MASGLDLIWNRFCLADCVPQRLKAAPLQTKLETPIFAQPFRFAIKRRILLGRRESPDLADKPHSPSARSANLRAQSLSPAKQHGGSQSQLRPTRTIPYPKIASLPRLVQTAGSRFHGRHGHSHLAPPHTPHSCPGETAAAFRSAPPGVAIRPESSPRKLRSADSPSKLSSPLPAPTWSQSTTGRRRPAGPYPSRTQTWSLAVPRAGKFSVRHRCEPQLRFCPPANKSPRPRSA